MENSDLISIVTPSFNQCNYIRYTIASVLSQKYNKYEYIIMDGGSTDGSLNIIKEYSKNLKYWISEKDGGQSDAINKGFRHAAGGILAYINSDDLYCPGAFEIVAEYFKSNPAIDVVIGDQETIDYEGRIVDIKKSIPISFKRSLYSACAVAQPATFFTRRAWELAGELDITLRYQMDFEYFLRMQAKGIRFGLIKHPLAQFRVHGESKTVSKHNDKTSWIAERRLVQDRYRRMAGYGNMREAWRESMMWMYRSQMFALRAMHRGVWMPFRGTRARKRAVG
jgi:glycosyltransferase involved in cell wall biosynthesis